MSGEQAVFKSSTRLYGTNTSIDFFSQTVRPSDRQTASPSGKADDMFCQFAGDFAGIRGFENEFVGG
ncbi:hypothetical protein B5X24_HaOG212481 [Helicoverpa armigera]|nr:hypothetical protein B5X24_HaOG212481 [Helicoverpa armigera]